MRVLLVEDDAELAQRLATALTDAGYAVDRKDDSSPVTEADHASERVILDGLRSAFPSIPCVAEEEAAAGILPADLGEAFFLVSPPSSASTQTSVAGSVGRQL